MKNKFSLLGGVLIIAAALALLPLTAQATSYIWSATSTTSAWETSGNWTTAGSPNSYSDQATIGVSNNNPVSLSGTSGTLGTVLLGGGGTGALTISNYSPNNAVALDIAAGGTLGMQGGILLSSSTTNAKQITIEGTLRNNAASSATTYTIGGGTSANDYIFLKGGTISSLNGGIWAFSRPVQGYGTISSPFTNANTISANTSGQTLHITGNSTAGGSFASTVAGAILSLESAITGVNISNHTGEIDLNGATLTNVTLANTGTAAINLTGNSTLAGTFTRNSNSPITLNGFTLNFNGETFGNVSGGTAAIAVGTGTLNNNSGNSSIANGDAITLAGGKITNNGGTFTIGTPVTGFGTMTGPLTMTNATKASGGMLTVDGTTGTFTTAGTTMLTNGVLGDVLDLKGTIAFGSGGFLYSNPSGGTGNGVIQLDGATLTGTINSNGLGQGAVNVIADSTVAGTYNSSATIGINSGKTLNISGGTLNVINNGSINGPGNVLISGSALSLQNANTLFANNFTMGPTATLTVGTSTLHPLMELTGNYSFQQTDPTKWTRGGTTGLGPDLKMAGTAVQTLEVGGVNGSGMTNNFALNGLTVGVGATVKLVDQFQNATVSGWTPGSEVLYLGSLIAGGVGDPILDLDGISCFVVDGTGFDQLFSGELYNGVTITDSTQVPIPPSFLLLGTGLLGLVALRRRKSKAVS